MKLKDIINNIDKSASNQDDSVTYNLDLFLNELDLHCYGITQDIDNPRLKCYWLANHLCTDTWVGFRAYFLDDIFICYSEQAARKSPEYIEWNNTESIQFVRDYIRSLDDRLFIEDYRIVNLERDMSEGYTIEYTGQCLDKNIIYEGDLVALVEQSDKNKEGGYNYHNITICKGSELKEVDIRDILIPWHVK